jgi:hypothetical protein
MRPRRLAHQHATDDRDRVLTHVFAQLTPTADDEPVCLVALGMTGNEPVNEMTRLGPAPLAERCTDSELVDGA